MEINCITNPDYKKTKTYYKSIADEDGEKEIKAHAFWDVYLWELHIPASVKKILS